MKLNLYQYKEKYRKYIKQVDKEVAEAIIDDIKEMLPTWNKSTKEFTDEELCAMCLIVCELTNRVGILKRLLTTEINKRESSNSCVNGPGKPTQKS